MNTVIILTFITTVAILDTRYYGTEAKIFTRCELAEQLLKNKFRRTILSNWVCLVENESGRNTSTINKLPDKSISYGLFQINNNAWCRKGREGGTCNMKCEDFLNDDIQDDAKCATLIFNKKGFHNWPGWVDKCSWRNSADLLKDCKIN